MILEICAADIHSVLAAKRAGAERVELCSSLETGGLTPSEGLIRAAVSSGIAVNVLIRPRSGDFVYDEDEVRIMEEDVARAVALGVNGVVIGALRHDGSIDCEVCRRLMAKAGKAEVTFHRAIDRCRDIVGSVSVLREMGFKRILTSGGRESALQGAEVIREMVRRAEGGIIIMAGAGVTPDNIKEIMERTGVSEVHASAKTTMHSSMEYCNDSVGGADWRESSYEKIISLRRSVSSHH